MLGSRFLLLLKDLFNNFLLLVLLNHRVLAEHLTHHEVHVALVLSNLIKSHEIERLLIALNVDFESIKSLFGGGLALLGEKRNTMLVEEVRNGVLSNLTVVSNTVLLESAGHINSGVVSAANLVLR